jgi:hypothetical protein
LRMEIVRAVIVSLMAVVAFDWCWFRESSSCGGFNVHDAG